MGLRNLIPMLWLLGLGLAGCSSSSADGEVTIFAAASLGSAFEELVAEYGAANPGSDVALNVGGSSSLREQILEGAPADVFASASPEIMAEVVAAGATVGASEVFAHNAMVIAVPAGSTSVTSLEDFARDELLIGLCAAQVPCGRYADQLFEQAGVVPSADTREPDVRALLAKLEAGELDGGILYQTDLVSSTSVTGWTPDPNVDVSYPIAALSDRSEAAAFMAFVLSDEGQTILARHGFLA